MASDLNDLDKVFADLDTGPARPRPQSGPRVLPIAVAAIALIGFGAIIWYAYSQGVRSGSEDAAPLLQPQGDAKTLPAEPGGMDVPHRDKTVYDCTLNPERCVDGVERILPPPEDPMRPTAQSSAPTSQQMPSQLMTNAEPAPPPPPSLLNTPAAPPTLNVTSSNEAPTPQSAPVAPVTQPSGQQAPATTAAQTPAARPAPPPPPLPTQTQTGTSRPAGTAPAAPAAQPRTGTVSGWKIQLAALRSEAEVQTDWARRQAQHRDLLGGLTLQIQKVEVTGKGTFYRMQAGPLADKAAADALCAKLKAVKMDCLAVKP